MYSCLKERGLSLCSPAGGLYVAWLGSFRGVWGRHHISLYAHNGWLYGSAQHLNQVPDEITTSEPFNQIAYLPLNKLALTRISGVHSEDQHCIG